MGVGKVAFHVLSLQTYFIICHKSEGPFVKGTSHSRDLLQVLKSRLSCGGNVMEFKGEILNLFPASVSRAVFSFRKPPRLVTQIVRLQNPQEETLLRLLTL